MIFQAIFFMLVVAVLPTPLSAQLSGRIQGTECTLDRNCPADRPTCEEGFCLDGVSCGPRDPVCLCSRDRHCPNRLPICNNGVCEACDQDQDCRFTISRTIGYLVDLPGNYACLDNPRGGKVCQITSVGIPARSCTSGGNCPAEFSYCVANRCQACNPNGNIGCVRGQTCRSSPRTTTITVGNFDRYYSDRLVRCEGAIQCTRSQDCPPEKPFCLMAGGSNPQGPRPNYCTECYANEDCPSEQPICNQEPSATDFYCRVCFNDFECPDAQICQQGRCIERPPQTGGPSGGNQSRNTSLAAPSFPLPRGACEQDSDCDDGNDCTQDRCTPAGLQGPICTYLPLQSLPCGGGNICEPRQCTAGGECVAGELLTCAPRPNCAVRCDPTALTATEACLYLCSPPPIAMQQTPPVTIREPETPPSDPCAEIVCDDRDPCTQDECRSGSCAYLPIDGCGEPDPGPEPQPTPDPGSEREDDPCQEAGDEYRAAVAAFEQQQITLADYIETYQAYYCNCLNISTDPEGYCHSCDDLLEEGDSIDDEAYQCCLDHGGLIVDWMLHCPQGKTPQEKVEGCKQISVHVAGDIAAGGKLNISNINVGNVQACCQVIHNRGPQFNNAYAFARACRISAGDEGTEPEDPCILFYRLYEKVPPECEPFPNEPEMDSLGTGPQVAPMQENKEKIEEPASAEGAGGSGCSLLR